MIVFSSRPSNSESRVKHTGVMRNMVRNMIIATYIISTYWLTNNTQTHSHIRTKLKSNSAAIELIMCRPQPGPAGFGRN